MIRQNDLLSQYAHSLENANLINQTVKETITGACDLMNAINGSDFMGCLKLTVRCTVKV